MLGPMVQHYALMEASMRSQICWYWQQELVLEILFKMNQKFAVALSVLYEEKILM